MFFRKCEMPSFVQGKFQHKSEPRPEQPDQLRHPATRVWRPKDSLQFPDLEEGGLATYRAAIVQNQHLKMNAAKQALENSKDLFPQLDPLDHPKCVIVQRLKRQKVRTDDRSATIDAILRTWARTRTGSDAAR
ncbi:uncharacterized protein LOC119765628 [Culex quinquefasciatus]|uniref:uncharacterized protein LOC119765628 n=1 Tax=Culex quinquefasciatus TaxID=7176 RepID=UPI0018E31768|nr:uncharacterized protein LOC119765628 [Culex quinquefasciatus]